MINKLKPFGAVNSIILFGSASALLLFETQVVIPWLSEKTGLETVIFWFLVAGLGMFLPLLITAILILKKEGFSLSFDTWQNRLRFKKITSRDIVTAILSIVLIGFFSFLIMKLVEFVTGHADTQPAFMYFEPLTPDRYWILLLWLPYWLLNIMGEEILWRGVILPRHEIAFGKSAWLFQGFCWAIFHIAFGWQLLLTLVPILFIQSYVVQRQKNSWIGVIVHAVVNGPSFIAISFGLL